MEGKSIEVHNWVRRFKFCKNLAPIEKSKYLSGFPLLNPKLVSTINPRPNRAKTTRNTMSCSLCSRLMRGLRLTPPASLSANVEAAGGYDGMLLVELGASPMLEACTWLSEAPWPSTMFKETSFAWSWTIKQQHCIAARCNNSASQTGNQKYQFDKSILLFSCQSFMSSDHNPWWPPSPAQNSTFRRLDKKEEPGW